MPVTAEDILAAMPALGTPNRAGTQAVLLDLLARIEAMEGGGGVVNSLALEDGSGALLLENGDTLTLEA